MTDTDTASPALSHRMDAIDPPWRTRPAIMAAICAIAGVIFHDLVKTANGSGGAYGFAAFVAVATAAFVLTVEKRRLLWAVVFAMLWGIVIGLITENNRGYNVDGSPFEWPFWSGLLAVGVAAPLFQTWRDVAESPRDWHWWRLPYDRLHLHAWTDAVIGAAGIVFVGISMALAFLISGLFSLIGITALEELLREGWFVMGLSGAAFGGAVGLLRERDKLVANLQRLVMVVLSVLAPVLAAALALFLFSLTVTGFAKLWESGFSTAGLMLGASAFAVLLANAVIGNGAEDRATNPIFRWSALVLAVAVLPLAAIGQYAMTLRIDQYGWTPERLWGIVAAMIALGYGVAGVWSLVRGHHDFDDVLRPLQQKLAIGLMVLATFLALPILDFGAISTRDQLARLESGAVKPAKFDWAAMAFDFGPDGRAALKRLAASSNAEHAYAAKRAMAAEYRWDLSEDFSENSIALMPIEKAVRVLPAGRTVTPELYKWLRGNTPCRRGPCIVQWLAPDRIAIIGRYGSDANISTSQARFDAGAKRWEKSYDHENERAQEDDSEIDLEKASVTIGTVPMAQIMVDGKPVGEPFAK